MMDGPNTHRMDAPADVTAWAVIPTTRNVVTDDGRNMTLRDEWWHIPTFVVDEIERAALAAARSEAPGELDAETLAPIIRSFPHLQDEYRDEDSGGTDRLDGESYARDLAYWIAARLREARS
jgi:hypothetical protein